MDLRPYRVLDEDAVVELWERCGLTRPWNDPKKDIARKLTVQPELFVVGEQQGRIVASAMAGYDGHRGWVYYVAVDPACQGQALGRRLMAHVEGLLLQLGCPKVNLQVRTGNVAAAGFYRALGYRADEAASLGKRLIADD